MSLKRTLRFTCLLALLLVAHFYMQSRYNSTTIMYELGSIKDGNLVEEAYKVYPNATFNWELKTPDYTLIMTTGNDSLHTRKTAVSGGWVNPFGQNITLSQSVASKMLRTDIVNHQPIKILEKNYLLNRVIKEGNDVYIPFNSALLTENWQHVRFYYTADNIETVELTDEQLANLMGLWGLKVYNKTFYKNQTLLFYNLALLLCVYKLLTIFKSALAQFYWLKDDLTQTRLRYLPFYGLKTFIKGEYQKLLRLSFQGIWCLLMLFVGFRLLTNMILPAMLIPGNWFSLSSYLDIGTQLVNSWRFQLQNGMAPISQATFFWLCVLALYLLSLDKLLFKTKSPSKAPLHEELA